MRLMSHTMPAVMAHNLLAQLAQLLAVLMALHLKALTLDMSLMGWLVQDCSQNRQGTTAEVVDS